MYKPMFGRDRVHGAEGAVVLHVRKPVEKRISRSFDVKFGGERGEVREVTYFSVF